MGNQAWPRVRDRITFGVLLLLFGPPTLASASSVTWEASGLVGTLADPLNVLPPIAIGTPWTLDITFDPTTPGTAISPCGAPSYRYAGAILSAQFEIGGFVYTNSLGDIVTNFDLPVGICGSPFNSLGLVQFQWLRGWSAAAGAPNLNFGLGLLLASYKDLNARDGSLPTFPDPDPVQTVFSGLEWDGILGFEQFTSDFTPTPAPVPEPATGTIVALGLAALIARRRLG